MTGFQSILLGILQGLTEFIPVSSTAHLLIAQKLLGIPGGNDMFSFLVIIQLGTLVSLMVFFWKDILHLIKAFFTKPFSTQENKLGWYIIIATIPALLAGYLLKSFVEAIFTKPLLEAAIRLLITAVVLVLAEGLGKRNRSLEKMNWLDALIIGIAQVIAIIPGASRSGTTISAGLGRGMDRPAAARFAFLMSIPVMLAAGGYQSLDLIKMPGIGTFLTTLVVGFVVAAVGGWLTVKWLLGYLSKHSLYLFAIYCAVVGAVSLIIYLLFP